MSFVVVAGRVYRQVAEWEVLGSSIRDTSVTILWHGSREVVEKLREGSFLSDKWEGAGQYAIYGPNGEEDAGPGWMNEFHVADSALILRFTSFADAYEHYGVTNYDIQEGMGTYTLSRNAVREGDADLIVVYDEFILVDPDVLNYVTSYPVTPDNWREAQ